MVVLSFGPHAPFPFPQEMKNISRCWRRHFCRCLWFFEAILLANLQAVSYLKLMCPPFLVKYCYLENQGSHIIHLLTYMLLETLLFPRADWVAFSIPWVALSIQPCQWNGDFILSQKDSFFSCLPYVVHYFWGPSICYLLRCNSDSWGQKSKHEMWRDFGH